ncbi:ABC transporter permease [Lichenifustis flavocetrariae]|uniref:ABC transporter permease n=1 Tax=Lichenifustis flavocetrariae TaxID=2949735 RepID=A0AA41Z3I1_9HYPH|nr:ABC transporter permease [Lichenifustis flavocetrariae]MCW6508607.1 ABC transporter permease [Lichenifustis flavocetrariae]
MTLITEAVAPPAAAAPGRVQVSRGPWATAFRKLRQDKAAMTALGVLVLIVVVCLMAPLYATYVSKTDPFSSNLSGTITVNGEDVAVMQAETEGLGLGTTPIGPTYTGAYFFGADTQGRDVMARLLYGGQNSLLIAGSSTVLTLVLAGLVGIVAGFFGGWVDIVLSRLLDIMWAFPVFLLAISLSIVTISHGLVIGPITISSDSLLLPILIIGLIFIPYVARPIRGQVLQLKRSEFVLAAIGLGVPQRRILVVDILPNVASTLIVFAPLTMALNMITESSLSFLSIGVQSPAASWGTIIEDGQGLLYTRPLVAVLPGIAVVITVVALNVFGDGVRDALDPRAKLRVKD